MTSNSDRTPRRLDFFWNMISMCGIDRAKGLADIVGLTQPAVQYWWIADDLSLSYILDIADKLGIELEFALVRRGDDADDTDDTEPLYMSDVAKQIGKKKFTIRRLEFIDFALRRYQILKPDITKAMGVGHTTVYSWFVKDDIMWSRVCQIAKTYDLDIHIKIRTPETQPERNAGPEIFVDIKRDYGYGIPETAGKKKKAGKSTTKESGQETGTGPEKINRQQD